MMNPVVTTSTVPVPTVAACVGLLAVVGAGVARAQPPDPTAEIRAYVEAYQETFNTKNASALAAYFADDTDVIFGNGSQSLGRAAIETWWRAYFARQERERRGRFDITSIRLLTPDVGLVNVLSTTSGTNAQGQDLLTRRARGAWVIVVREGTWQIVLMRGLPMEGEPAR